jgi:rhodanese-related sulfurtransferase
MQKKLLKKCNILIITALFIGLAFLSTVNAKQNLNNQESSIINENKTYTNNFDGYTNLSVQEIWDLLNSTSNGIQIPIDVRTDQEWINWHFDTPYPEHPRHHILTDLQDPIKLQEFMELYQGKEIILTCHSGKRSWTATQILINNHFNGTIYNNPGGIVGWSAAGFPTVGNRNPNKPTINGPTGGRPDKQYNFTIVTTDPDYDDIYLLINWSDGSSEVLFGPFASGEEVTLNHTWTEKNTYTIKIKAQDRYGNESEEATFDISIPRNRFTNTYMIQWIFNRYPIIKWLIGKI